MKVLVAGTDETHNLMDDFKVTQKLNSKNTASFTLLRKPENSGTDQAVQQYMEVEIYDEHDRRIFWGSIDSLEPSKPGEPVSEVKTIAIKCVGRAFTFDRRVIRRSYEGRSAEFIIDDIINNRLTNEGLSLGYIEDSSEIPELNFNIVKARDAIDKLAKNTGSAWTVDAEGKIHFFQGSLDESTFDLDPNSEVEREDITISRSDYRNRQYVKTKKVNEYKTVERNFDAEESTQVIQDTDSVGVPIVERQNGSEDGASFFWFNNEIVEVKEARIVRTGNVTGVNVVEDDLNVGFGSKHRIGGSGSFSNLDTGVYQWTEQNVDATVLNDEEGNPSNVIQLSPELRGLNEDEYVELTYIPKTDSTVVVESTGEIEDKKSIGPGSGIFSHVTDEGAYNTIESARAYGGSLINRFSTNTPTISYGVWGAEIKPGQSQTVNLPKAGIEGEDYVIRTITTSYGGEEPRRDGVLHREVEAVDQSYYQGFESYYDDTTPRGEEKRQQSISIPPAEGDPTQDGGDDQTDTEDAQDRYPNLSPDQSQDSDQGGGGRLADSSFHTSGGGSTGLPFTYVVENPVLTNSYGVPTAIDAVDSNFNLKSQIDITNILSDSETYNDLNVISDASVNVGSYNAHIVVEPGDIYTIDLMQSYREKEAAIVNVVRKDELHVDVSSGYYFPRSDVETDYHFAYYQDSLHMGFGGSVQAVSTTATSAWTVTESNYFIVGLLTHSTGGLRALARFATVDQYGGITEQDAAYVVDARNNGRSLTERKLNPKGDDGIVDEYSVFDVGMGESYPESRYFAYRGDRMYVNGHIYSELALDDFANTPRRIAGVVN